MTTSKKNPKAIATKQARELAVLQKNHKTVSLNCLPCPRFYVTSLYGPRGAVATSGGFSTTNHQGIDLAASSNDAAGDPLYSVKDNGKVTACAYSSGYGNYVIIKYSGFSVRYAHLQKTNVSVGNIVNTRTIIGRMGATGNVSGVHLHFEIIVNGKTIDPWYSLYLARGSVKAEGEKPSDYNSVKNIASGVGVYTTDNPADNSQEIPGSLSVNYKYQRYILDLDDITVRKQLFGRKFRVMVFDKSNKGVDLSDLRCTFDIIKPYAMTDDFSVISIYNLNTSTEANLIKNAKRITVEAGYDNIFGLIYDGDVVQPTRYKENSTDYVAKFVCIDGYRFTSVAFSATTYPRGQTKRDVIKNIQNKNKANVKPGSISEAYNKSKYIRGKVCFGNSKKVLGNIAKTVSGSKMYMDNGKVNLVTISDLPKDQVLELNQSSGLIGTPSQTSDGIEFECLLNPRLKVNMFVHISNSMITEKQITELGDYNYTLNKDGVYRIIEVRFVGDTRGNDWKCTCQAVSQSGTVPDFISTMVGGN